jgi:hypothetical protein
MLELSLFGTPAFVASITGALFTGLAVIGLMSYPPGACARWWPCMASAGWCRRGTSAAEWVVLDPDEVQQARTCVFLSQSAGAVSPLAVAEFAVAGTLRPVAGSPVTATAGPGSWPGSVDREPLSQPRRGIASVMGTAPMRTSSSGSPGWLAVVGS